MVAQSSFHTGKHRTPDKERGLDHEPAFVYETRETLPIFHRREIVSRVRSDSFSRAKETSTRSTRPWQSTILRRGYFHTT